MIETSLSDPLIYSILEDITFLTNYFLRQNFSVTVLAVLELALVDQAVLELTEIRLPLCLPSVGMKCVHHHSPGVFLVLTNVS